MRELPDFGEFDLVWALDDAINYLLSAEELEQALSGMRANLAPGGLLMFDVNTPAGLPHLLRRRTAWSSAAGGGWSGRGQGSADARAGLDLRSALRSRAAGEDGRGASRRMSTASATSPKPRCWQRWRAAGLECLDVYGHGFDAVPKQPVEELVHTKAVYIARRA